MSHMHCPECGMSVRLRADYLPLTHCPRCLAQGRQPVTMIRAGPSKVISTATSARRAGASQQRHPERRSIPGELVIRIQRDAGTLRLVLSGELDLASAEHLDRELQDATDDEATRLVVDLSALRFMDSSGLHVLLDAADRCRADSRPLSLMRGIPLVQRLFKLTAVEDTFTFED
jgi:anti-sigma B factor antagonist